MGNYVNPGNIAFKRINGPDYVDKTMLIELINARSEQINVLSVSADHVVLVNPMLRKCSQRIMMLPVILTAYLMTRKLPKVHLMKSI